ncbi:MAG: bacillithiol system redox-active protein YtxJ [Bacteroidota bacterium]|jgi:bacillithiol system protein YtxJ|nr:bacillithiol system redox-active protein YtxJ [Bacteroidota bacterium]
MNWIPLENEDQIDEIILKSQNKPQVIFKHSTRCSVSSMAKNRLDKNEQPEGIEFYFLDLIKYRKISNKIADDFKITHQSPQILVISQGKCVYDDSHLGITLEDVKSSVLVN